MSPELENVFKILGIVLIFVVSGGGVVGAVAFLKWLKANPDKATELENLLAASIDPETAKRILAIAEAAQKLQAETQAALQIVIGLLDGKPGIDPTPPPATPATPAPDTQTQINVGVGQTVTVETPAPDAIKEGGLG